MAIIWALYILPLFLGTVHAFPALSLSWSTLFQHASKRATPALPSGWSYRACYQDSGSNRVLPFEVYSGNANTPQSCVATCNRGGFTYAGVEYGEQCFCGNALNSPAPGTCTMACTGDSTQTCGGNNEISVYTTTTAAFTPAYQSYGCYVDSSSRVLPNEEVASNTMTTGSCASICAGSGYSFFGTEAGTECWCGTSPPSGSTTSGCTTPCGGAASAMCGGGWRINVYGLLATSSSSSSTTSTPSSTSITSSTSTTSSTTTTSRLTSTTSSTTSSSTVTTTSTTATTTASSTPAGWISLGCYVDQSNRTLTGPSYNENTMTTELCQQLCTGYTYAGTEYNTQCYCGNTMTISQTSTGCVSPCQGNSNEICGGSWAMNIYQYRSVGGSTSVSSSTSTSSTATSTSSTVITSTTTSTAAPTPTWSSIGCYTDQSTRLLPGPHYTLSNLTTQSCQQLCSGYTYAGTEYADECYCGNSMVPPVNTSTGCSAGCAGNSNEVCGGTWAINVYQQVTPTTTSSVPSTTSTSSVSSTTTTSLSTTTLTSTTTATSTASSTSASATSSATPTGSWTPVGCFVDQSNRTLANATYNEGNMTPVMCETLCLGWIYAGVENGVECYCGDSFTANQTSTACTTPCGGNSSLTCGGSWAMNIFEVPGGTPTVQLGSLTAGNFWSNSASDSPDKWVVAHFIVGNSYTYTQQKWEADILLAASQGIDAFALNIGADTWEPDRMADAYAAAETIQSTMGITFKMFISFDMTSISCGDTSFIVSSMQQYSSHPLQLKDPNGAMWVATFAGDGCMSGSSWQSVLNSANVTYRFIPAFFNTGLSPTNTLKDQEPAIGGDFLWNGGWPSPTAASTINWDEDGYRQSVDGLNRAGGDIYMAAVSPYFFSHFSYKNFVYDSDNWLYAERWEELHDKRDTVDAVEILTWNDWGESHYIAPVDPEQQDIPSGDFWANNVYDHTAWLYMTGYYISYFKTGVRPTVTSDKVFMWARTMSVNTYLPSDPYGAPQYLNFLSDTLFVVLFATNPGTLTVNQGSGQQWSAQVNTGVNMLNSSLVVTNSVSASLTRNGQQVFSFSAPLFFGVGNPSEYNYNAITASGP